MQFFDAVRATWPRGRGVAGGLLLGGAAVLLSGTLLGVPILSAQQPAQASAPATGQKTATDKPTTNKPTAHEPSHAAAAHRYTAKRNTAKRGSRQPSPAVTASAAPAAPPLPDWPANRQPNRATVVWDSHGLEIEASNSSLDQILHEVATDTGANVEGFNKDQRVFGTYGPGPAREVLSSLLDGSGYNVIMVGGAGDQPPRKIVLSTFTAAPSPLANANPGPSIEQQEEQEQQREEDSGPPQPAYPMPPHSPQEVQQQMQQKMQERQQQMQQMQQREQLREQEPE